LFSESRGDQSLAPGFGRFGQRNANGGAAGERGQEMHFVGGQGKEPVKRSRSEADFPGSIQLEGGGPEAHVAAGHAARRETSVHFGEELAPVAFEAIRGRFFERLGDGGVEGAEIADAFEAGEAKSG
jgi:hypothetical protein